MGKIRCPNGHPVWNGTGEAYAFLYRFKFFEEFTKKHPDCILDIEDINNKYGQLFDLVDGIEGEDLDGWYCLECEALTIFYARNGKEKRIDFNKLKEIPSSLPCLQVPLSDLSPDILLSLGWEEYAIFFQVENSSLFDEFCHKKTPWEALQTYPFEYRSFVAPSKDYIIALNNTNSGDKISFVYQKVAFYEIN